MQKRSLTIHGHRTSISLEEPFWIALNDIAKARQQSVASLVQMIDKERVGGLSSAIVCLYWPNYDISLPPATTTRPARSFK